MTYMYFRIPTHSHNKGCDITVLVDTFCSKVIGTVRTTCDKIDVVLFFKGNVCLFRIPVRVGRDIRKIL